MSTHNTTSTSDNGRAMARDKASKKESGAQPATTKEQAAWARETQPVSGKATCSDTAVAFATTVPGAGVTPNAAVGERWKGVQAEFVDDPRRAVGAARDIVGELSSEVMKAIEQERDQIEQKWSTDQGMSTEELRKCLQRYREFYSHLQLWAARD